MNKRIVKTISIWFLLNILVLAIFVLLYPVWYFFNYAFSDCSVNAETWLDSDGDGIRDRGERPLRDVCVWANSDYPSLEQDLYGNPVCSSEVGISNMYGESSTMYGCVDSSTKFVSAKAPPGYQSTTPSVVKYDSPVEFGFAPLDVEVSQKILPIEEYVKLYQQEAKLEAFRKRLIRLAGILAYLVVTIAFSLYLAKKLDKRTRPV